MNGKMETKQRRVCCGGGTVHVPVGAKTMDGDSDPIGEGLFDVFLDFFDGAMVLTFEDGALLLYGCGPLVFPGAFFFELGAFDGFALGKCDGCGEAVGSFVSFGSFVLGARDG